MLERGWYPVTQGMPSDALLRIPVRVAPNFEFNDRVDVNWTEMWCNCLWVRLRASGRGTARDYALAVQQYNKSPRLRRSILITAKLSGNLAPEEKIAIDKALSRLDAEYATELQRTSSPERVENADRGESDRQG